jgi:hypothetical protein
MLFAGEHRDARITQQRSTAMTTKRLVLATSMLVLVAMSAQAYAGETISDKRYWPSEASSVDQYAVQRAENAFDSAAMPRGVEAGAQSYHGGPKEID